MKLTVTVNGRQVAAEVEDRTLLVHFVRDAAGLTATNIGCDTSSCGACTVLLDGQSVKSCTVLAAQADGCEVVTVEGLAGPDGELHPMQRAFHAEHGLQCGFCTPGMLLTAQDLLTHKDLLAHGDLLAHRVPSREEIREYLCGNYCRCTGYQAIVDAVEAVARARTRP